MSKHIATRFHNGMANKFMNSHRRRLNGAAGGLGTALRSRLKAQCEEFKLSDKEAVSPAQSGEEVVKADLAVASEVDARVAGCDTIIHLGGISIEAPFEALLQANILVVCHRYEAACRHGMKRVVFASSNRVTGFYRKSETITADHPARPDGCFGVSKAFGEDFSRFYFHALLRRAGAGADGRDPHPRAVAMAARTRSVRGTA